jgi:hypothetical protein
MPILGVIDSAKTGRLANPSFYQIATATPSGVTNYTFSSIPQGYQHLQIRYFAKDNRSPVYSGLALRFNGDTGANYWYSFADVATTQVPTFGNYYDSASTDAFCGNSPGGTNNNYWGSGWHTIFNYSDTSMWKYTGGVGGNNGVGDGSYGGFVSQPGNIWRSTAAITSINIRSNTGSTLTAGTRISLYGIKGS